MKKIITEGPTLRTGILEQIRTAIAEIGTSGVIITVQKLRQIHSKNQRGYYWEVIVGSVIIGASEMWGEDLSKEDAHELLKRECNYKELVKDNEHIIKLPQSTKSFNTLEAEQYYERCRKFVYEWFNIICPLPNEHLQIDPTL